MAGYSVGGSPDASGQGGAAPAARPGCSASLEQLQNVVTLPPDRVFELARCGCGCWYCPDCCERMGYNLRAELVPILETFTGLMMLTLTVDPELFPSPRSAYLYVRERRGISILMQALDRGGHLHTRRYFYVVEFQRETELAHFHLSVDASYIPKAAIDDAWSKLRPKAAGPPAPNRPAFGMTRFSVRKFDGGPVHAARYATKYLVKAPEHGFPAWVLAMGAVQRLPRYRASRGFWGRPTRPRREPQSERTVTPRTYEQRRTECGTACDLFGLDEHVNELTGEVIRLRNWESRLAIDGGIIGVISPAAKPGARRTTLIASGVSACIASLELAAGEPIRVISGRGVDRRTLR